MSANTNLVSTAWLEDHLSAPDLVVVDASWYLPTQGRDGKAEYAAGHIPGAVHFDIDAVSDHDDPLPHMLPRPEEFARHMAALGIGDGMRVVVYDGLGMFAAPRVWWMLHSFGVRDAAVLDGGAPKWKSEGRPWTDEPTRRRPAVFTPRFDHGAVASREDIARMLAAGSHQVVDARAADRFRGDAPEPRPGLKAGHMPGARNVPWTDIVRNGELKSPEEIRAAFEQAGVDLKQPIVTTCGSGVSAAILTLALNTAGVNTKALYDGSWAEWGGRDDCPVATGPA
ncbi:sulfurtransferase [Alsobacter metallidurans]|uniref:3-mercaptopyruvate sulfurtransferase n=1 Tax=Alsobacter metallidurans TaxID=340221 RepID=A0A917MHU8_9HYPH|nr:3-mercaptopyruvate sulfurtransferase [Alsobacter metallidurans]GGH22631.1 sulfurtransferase [Alsobacter metallidurans]